MPEDNILFLFTDQWRADCLGSHGHPIVRTPNLDALCEHSADFTNSFTVVPLCTPARGTIMTGHLPHQTGVIDNCDVGASGQEYLHKDAYTWQNAAAQAGYRTGYFGKWHLGGDWPENQTEIEFDPCREGRDWDRAAHARTGRPVPVTERGQFHPGEGPTTGPDSNGNRSPFYEKLDDVSERMEYVVTQKALDFLARDDGSPWCLTASFVGPHFPSALPEPYFSMYPSEEMPLPESIDDRLLNKPWFQGRNWWPSVSTDCFDAREWKKTISAYYGGVTMMDALLGEILEAARGHGNGRKTRVIFTADHGEMLGAHGKFDKHAYFYEEVMRTPLLICSDLNGSQPGLKREEFCNSQDLAQTFFEMCGTKRGAGESLLPLLDPTYSDDRQQVTFGSYYKYNGHSFEIRCIRTERYKYSWIPQDIDELYDLQNDPHEMHNLSDRDAYLSVKSELKERLMAHLAEVDDYILKQADPLPAAGSIGKPDYPPLSCP